MNYQNIYNQLIKHRRENVPAGYCEVHHILPKCLGGCDIEENRVALTAREHYIAHALLCRIHPNNPKLFYAFRMMSAKNIYQNRSESESRIYKKLKEQAAQFSSERIKNSQVIHNRTSLEVKYINKTDSIPEGWHKGSNKQNNIGKQRYYNKNLDVEKLFDNNIVIPNGFTKGRRPIDKMYSRSGLIRKKTTEVDDELWFDSPVSTLKIVNIKTGDIKSILSVDKIPCGFVESILTKSRRISSVHLITKNVALLTQCEYENNVMWVRTGLKNPILYHTDIGIVRSKDEYIRKSKKSINIKEYCERNYKKVTSWLVVRSNLPASWENKTWKELGFYIVDI